MAKSFYQMWVHGVLLKEGYDNKVYQMKIADERGERQLHYYALNQLLIIRFHPNPKYREPKID